jgi:hypothetical protein
MADGKTKEIDMDGKGTYRTRGAEGAPDTARVVDRSVAFDLPEQQYRRRGYAPPFEELSWKPGVEEAVA